MNQTAQLLIILLITSIAILAAGYVPLVLWVLKERRRGIQNNATAERESQLILDEAKHRASLIVNSAEMSSTAQREFLAGLANTTRATLDAKLENISRLRVAEFDQFTASLFADYRKAFSEGQAKDINSIHTMTESLGPQMSEYANLLKQALDKSSKESMTAFEQGVTAEWDQAKKDIEEYKAYQKAKIEARGWEVISKAAFEVLTKSLSPADHKKLVIQALEKASYESKS